MPLTDAQLTLLALLVPGAAQPRTRPERGTLSWDSEGQEGGPYDSRRLHVPSDTSGLTLGRGYDMGSRSAAAIEKDLSEAGVPADQARLIAKAAGLSGDDARQFIRDHKLADFRIDPVAQVKLFDTAMDEQAAEAKRICTKDDVVKKYGACDWDALEPAIRDMVVDLKFRGDYTPAARTRIQRAVAENDLETLATVISDKSQWPGVPKDRFERRRDFIQDALAKARAKAKEKAQEKPGSATPAPP